jgi:hypothetical protein
MVVAQLIFEMAANVARLQSDMQKANSTVTSTMQGIKGAADMAKKALAAVGVALGVREFADMIRSSAEALDHLRQLSIQTGITVETLSALKGVAKAAGADLDTVAKSVNILEKNMLAAVNGNAKMAQAFADLGVSREELAAGLQNMDEFLPGFARKLLDAGESGQLAAEAIKLTGRAGAQSLPFWEQLAAVQALHGKVTTENTEQAHQFIVSLREMEARSVALKREFTLGLLPALNSIMGAFADSTVSSQGAREAGEAFGTMMRWAAQGIYGAWSALNLFGKTLGLVTAAFTAITTGDVKGAIGILREGMVDIAKTAADAGAAITAMGEAAKKLPDVRRPGGRRGRASADTTGAGGDTTDENYAGEFAAGGTIPAGEWGVVGESGPEIVSGGGSGVQVTPAGGSGGGGVTLGAIAEQAKRLNKELRETKVLGADAGDLLERAGVRGVKSMKDLDGVVRNLAVELLRLAANPLLKSASSAIGNFFSAGASSAASGSSWGDFAGGFAEGGTIPPGAWGVVGENGPEIVSGGSGGATVANIGGGGDLYVNIHAPGADAAKLNQVIAELRGLRAAVGGMAIDAVRKAFNSRGYVTAMG